MNIIILQERLNSAAVAEQPRPIASNTAADECSSHMVVLQNHTFRQETAASPQYYLEQIFIYNLIFRRMKHKNI
jgi:hypothetical protein